MKTLILLTAFLVGLGCGTTTERFTIPALKERAIALRGNDFSRNQESYTALKAQFERDSTDLKSLVRIAQLFVLEGRATGDQAYYAKAATQLVDRVLQREPDNFEALVVKGTVLMTYHRFAEALAIAERAQGISKGGNAFVLGLLVDANVELGNYEAALQACDAMLALRPDLRSYSRAAYLRELHGDLAGAKQAMRMAAESGMYGAEDRAWAFTELGKLYLAEASYDTALFMFNGVLEERPSYAAAIAAKAEVLSAKGNQRESIVMLKEALQLTPSHEFAEMLADLYAEGGDTTSAQNMQAQVLSMFNQDEQFGWQIGREFAEFCLTHNIHLDTAFQYAEKDWRSRPENIHAQEVYAWALAAKGRAPEAVPYIEAAMRLGTRDLGMIANAAHIYHLAGMNDKAKTMLNKLSLYERCLSPAEQAELGDLRSLVAAKNN